MHASLVLYPRIISTSFITGTGFIKCMPITCSGRLVAAAILVIEIDEVLEASMVAGWHIASSCLNIFSLISMFSVAASTTKSESLHISSAVLVLRLARVAALASSVRLPLATIRSRFLVMVASALSSAGCATSTRLTVNPFIANTWAIPLPIVPAPITETFFIAITIDFADVKI